MDLKTLCVLAGLNSFVEGVWISPALDCPWDILDSPKQSHALSLQPVPFCL